jgi:type I restriction enzyme S subunit
VKELPEGWEYSTLLDAVGGVDSLVVGGPFGSCLKVEHYLDEGVPIIRLQNIGRRKFIKKDIKYVSPEKAEELSYHSYRSGDLVLAKLGDPIGKTCIIPESEENGIVVSDAVRIRNSNKNLSSKYLMYILNSDSVARQLNKQVFGTTRPRVNLQEVRRLVFPLPPLPVQRQIVAVLEQAEAVKRQRHEADALTGALLQSVFREMFGDPVTNEMGWEVLPLGKICSEIYRYPTFYGFKYAESGVPVVRIANILFSGGMNSDLEKYVFIKKEISQKFPRTIIEYNDILMAVRGDGSTVKRIGIVDTPKLIGANMSPNLIRIKANQNILSPHYLFHLMTSEMGQKLLEKYVSRTAKKTITGENIKQISIPLPPLALQQQFARVVEEVERIREQQVASGKEIEGLCEGLMQKAFAGELVG